jgi:pyrroline-5-carboxylate reductase
VTSFSTAFIGAGNMAYSIIAGLVDAGTDPALLRAANRGEAKLERLRGLGLSALGTDNRAAASGADVVVLAVKPQVMRGVCEELAGAVSANQLVISLAVGISAATLRDWLGGQPAVVRCMPNTPSLLRAGAAGLFAGTGVSPVQREQAAAIMGAVGVVRWVEDESLLHTVTAVAGSGPAYFFLFMEAMIAEAQRMGLDAESARILCAQTCIGAGRMVAEGGVDAAELRRRVCSPGGTTEPAVAALQDGALDKLVQRAMRACHARSEEMARELS